MALIFEGTGVAHVHAKLMPLHGDLASPDRMWWSKETEFSEVYRGWLTLQKSKNGRAQLDEIQARILAVQGK